MASFNEVLAVSAPSPDGGARRLLRWLCTSNPFYVLSAGLFLVGLRLSFGSPQTEEVETWALMSGLGGYTLLLAVTAFLLVRFYRVWDDARTVLLLVVLMFLATSVTFDEVLINKPDLGAGCYLGGLLFAVAVSEGLLHGIRLRLPEWFRTPYYLILALFFLYPLALGQLQKPEQRETLLWGLFGFSAVAGLVFLTLLPAIRLGRDYVRDNGSPWPWPLYPWTLFVILGLAVPARALLLCFSMHLPNPDLYDRLIFGPYFLVPFGLALAVLLLEIGLVSARRGVLALAMILPLGLILLALVGHRTDPVYEGFLQRFSDRLGGDPLYLTLLALIVFYGYAALRRVPVATEVVTTLLLTLAVVGPDLLQRVAFRPPQALPILAAALLQIALGHWQRSCWRCLAGTVGLVAGTALVFPGSIVFHLGLAAVLLIGAAFDDGLARLLRVVGSALILLACLTTQFVPFAEESMPREVQEGYPLLMALLLTVYGRWLNDRVVVALAVLVLTSWLAVAGWRGYCFLRLILKGLDFLAVSLGLFVLALLISLGKAGVLRWGNGVAGSRPGAER